MSALDGLLIGALLLAGVVALRSLPWTDQEIAAVHRAGVALWRGAWAQRAAGRPSTTRDL